MSHNKTAPEGKDPALWEIAQKRASFKSHAITYFIVNLFFWGMWVFSTGTDDDGNNLKGHGYPWPIWTTLGWGIGLAFDFANTYIYTKSNSIEKEYEKLKNQQKN